MLEIRDWRSICIKGLFLEVNGSVNVRQVVFLSTAEQVADEFGNRKLSIMAELVEELFIFVRNGSMNIFVASKFLLCANSFHVISFAVVNSRSATLITQFFSPLFGVSLRGEK